MTKRYRFADWTLAADPGDRARYVGRCVVCGERSGDIGTADEAQVWCLKHAGRTGDTRFEMQVSQRFVAAPKDGP